MHNNYDPEECRRRPYWNRLLLNLIPVWSILILLIAMLWVLLFINYFRERLPQGMNPMDVLNNVIAPLLVSAITGAFAWLGGRFKSKWEFRQTIDAAPRAYVNELDKLINRAHSEGVEKAVINGRAIVAARNSLRSTLMSISKQLNSEIDRLSAEVGEGKGHFDTLQSSLGNEEKRDPQRIFETLEVLVRIWPAKKVQIEVEIRKLMAEMGLDLSATKL